MKIFNRFAITILTTIIFISHTLPLHATSDVEEESTYPIYSSSDAISDWPTGPSIYASSGIVIEASTGAVLYDKNMNEKMYPASITKILTALLVLENTTMDEIVTYSHDSVFSIEKGSSHIAINQDEKLTVEDSLYGLILASANEVANGLAEHISGSKEEFAKLMTERAKDLGAINSNFTNPSGLHDENHYTTSYDMAMISRAVIDNETFIKINSTLSYMIPPTNLQTESRPLNTNHKLLLNGSNHYDGCFGGKTGYTSTAGSTLVTFAERNGIVLISVVMNSNSSNVFEDTRLLLDYGFGNFKMLNVSENETKYSFTNDSFFDAAEAMFENTNPILELDSNDYVILPLYADFKDIIATISYDNDLNNDDNILASINYTLNGHFVGSTSLNIVNKNLDTFSFGTSKEPTETETIKEPVQEKNYLTINIWVLLLLILSVFLLIFFFFYLTATRHQRMRKKRIRRKQKMLSQRRRRNSSRYSTKDLFE
ncbi:MAG: D-alanyl-D-alanine carboxypeptidase [Clostridiales bacterium]|nr:D-alanyl-D-alanine carboxypeptidase [Clostridiales bacterium]